MAAQCFPKMTKAQVRTYPKMVLGNMALLAEAVIICFNTWLETICYYAHIKITKNKLGRY